MVFGFKKKRSQDTFKTRVAMFWEWFAPQAERFYQTIEAGDCTSLVDEVSENMARLLPNLSWVFGPGEGGGHSFTVTGEGQVAKQMLAEYWKSHAPQLPGWTFYASRQPSSDERLQGVAIGIGENAQIDAEGFLIKSTVDNEAELIDIVAWHPSLSELAEPHHYEVLFLLLDEALGEFGTQMWLGDIQIEAFPPAEATTNIQNLRKFIKQAANYHEWEKLPPLKSYSLYEVPEQADFPRGDTLVGLTCIPNIVFELLDNQGALEENPLEGTGAEFAYLAIDGDVFPEGEQSAVRGNIEEALQEALEEHASGRVFGGAFGTQQSYIDLLLFDGDNSRAIVLETMQRLQLHQRSRLQRLS